VVCGVRGNQLVTIMWKLLVQFLVKCQSELLRRGRIGIVSGAPPRRRNVLSNRVGDATEDLLFLDAPAVSTIYRRNCSRCW
jgi:predicted RecB family nuclease